MEFREMLRLGIKSLARHKLRTLLTMLGVIFGVGAVISMMSIGEGARRAAIEQIKLLGTNNIRIKKLELPHRADEEEFQESNSPGLTWQDAEAIADKLPTALGVSALRFVPEGIFYGGNAPQGVTVVGVSDHYDELTNSYPTEGRFLAHLDTRSAERVCILGSEVKRELFGVESALDQVVKIGEENFRVVGVMGEKNLRDGKASVIKLRNINRDVYIPITTALKRFTDADYPDQVEEIAVQVSGAGVVVPSSVVIKRILERTHFGVADYEVLIPDELLAQSQRTQRIFNIVMGSIAALSLLVGGIGIMNIMLASVTERTKEIGIRRALGASERDILGQFLNETVLIAVSGGLIGVVLGALMALAINLFAHWDTVVSPSSIIVSFGISGTVGVIFGLYPAQQAARKDPIIALRFE
jgi:putative ABC transport system permease protein